MEKTTGLAETKSNNKESVTPRPQKKRDQDQQKKPRLTREQIEARKQEYLERKVTMARERDTRVARIESPLGNIAFNILRQFDPVYKRINGNLGAFAGPMRKKYLDYYDQTESIIAQLSDLTETLCKDVGYSYIVPQELKELKKWKTKDRQKHQSEEAEKE